MTEELKLIPKRLYDFLLGQDHFDGYFFGDWRDNQPFWWRKHLREAEDLTHPSTPPAVSDDLVEEIARAICTASGEIWRSNEGRSKAAIQMCDHNALNDHWRYTARAILPNIHRREQQAAEAMRERCAAWLNAQTLDADEYDEKLDKLATAIRSLTTEEKP